MNFDATWKDACRITGLKGGSLTYAVKKGLIVRSEYRPYRYSIDNLREFVSQRNLGIAENSEVFIVRGSSKYRIDETSEEYGAVMDWIRRADSSNSIISGMAPITEVE